MRTQESQIRPTKQSVVKTGPPFSSPNDIEEDVPEIVHDILASPGRPLDTQTREFFEPRFGLDLARERVHADATAARSAQAVAAQAYTVGQNIVFAKGRYAPQRSAGRVNLIAHELAHVAQQGSANSASFQGQILAREPAPSDPSDEDRLVDVERQLIQQQQQIQSLEQEQSGTERSTQRGGRLKTKFLGSTTPLMG